MSHTVKPTIVITTGEPAGIGPDICIALHEYLVQQGMYQKLSVVFLADPDLIRQRSQALGASISINIASNEIQQSTQNITNQMLIHPFSLGVTCVPGSPDQRNSAYVLQLIDHAVAGCLSGDYAAMVTAPVSKSIINQAHIITFSGHTEYIAEQCGQDLVVMMLMSEKMRVALLTTHVPLSCVSALVTADRLKKTILILNSYLQQYFALANPRIIVCGLNPHAGEGGYLGTEEIEIIEPVINALNSNDKMNLVGPLPADSLFQPSTLADFDVVLCMYHDQGLPVLKYASFGQAMNITLGLPFIRTSVDHGTAFNLAGSGKADPSSLIYTVLKTYQLLMNKN